MSDGKREVEFESFPAAYDDEEESTLSTKIKRFFSSASTTSSTSATPLPGPPLTATEPLAFPSLAAFTTFSAPAAPATPVPTALTAAALSLNNNPSSALDATKPVPRTPPPVRKQSVPTVNPAAPNAANQPRSRAATPDFPILANGRRMVRPLRLSGVAPSVRLTVAHSEKGDLVQSGSSRSIASEYRFGGGDVSASPTASEGFASLNLSSIPGFPLGRDKGDDAQSIRSVSTVQRPSASVAHIFRRLRGEGLSKEYWIRDESSKECYDCQTVFTAFRRKHHCRICGQIFCSRCASNIISSARFGSQGFVRVCNLCLSIMEDGDPSHDEQASRFRSGLRESTTFTISAPLEASARPPQSQFAASHLFPRSETPYYVPSIGGGADDSFGGRGTAMSETSSRPGTPNDYFEEEAISPKRALLGSQLELFAAASRAGGQSPPGANALTAAAPFRRGLAEEDKAPEGPVVEGLGITDPIGLGLNAEVDEEDASTGEEGLRRATESPVPEGELFPPESAASTLPTIAEMIASSRPPSPSTVAAAPPPPPAPGPREEEAMDSQVTLDSRHRSPESTDGGSAFAEQPAEPVFLRLPVNYPLQTTDAAGFTPVTIQHIRRMLRQSLLRALVPNAVAWENVLVELLVTVANSTAPNIRLGDSIDIRNYVHVKRIPGGHPRDSEYVDGIVFTKNVMHKKMKRQLSNPRIMLVSFPLEYQRVENQLMSLEPIVKQERESLRNLASRISFLKPHIVLAERNVSRLALEYLMEEKIAVARNVKPEVIAAVARSAQAEIVSSMDQLLNNVRLGRCRTYRIQTFVHSLIPGRKTFMRLEGCRPELGCTLLLRGGSMEVLTKIKKIVDVMLLVVYSAKLEGHLIRDEFVVPAPTEVKRPLTNISDDLVPEPFLNNLAAQARERVSQDITRALQPYETTALSASPWVKFPPPYPLVRMSEEDHAVNRLRRLRELEESTQILHEEAAAANHDKERDQETLSELTPSASSLSLSSILSERSTTGSLSEHREKLEAEAMKVLQTPLDVARQSEFLDAEARHAVHLAEWDAYLAQSRDSLDPADHQKLYVLESLACSQTDRLCTPPTVRAITFYGENDLALGQYIENVCRDAGKACAIATCQRHLMVHYKTWVHGQYRVSIIPEAHAVDLQNPEFEGQIIMFGWCKKCNISSPQAAMSEETYRLSFGKYLELCFYPQDLVRADGLCAHNGHLDHVRYWMYRGITLQITIEAVDLCNIVAPPLCLKIKPEKQLRLRNEEYATVLHKSTAFWDSILHRIASFNYDLVAADRLEEAHTLMDELKLRCEIDRRTIVKLLEKTYGEAQATNGTEMTSVRRALQNKAVEWEGEFASFEQRILPSDKDVRRMTTVQIKRLFSDSAAPFSPERRGPTPGLAPSIELDEKQDLLALDSSEPPSETNTVTSATLADLDPDSIFSSLSGSTSSAGTGQLALSSLPSPGLTAVSPKPSHGHHSTDNESDSTVCAQSPTKPTSRTASPFMTRHRSSLESHDDTSGAESDAEYTPTRRRPAVSDLVSFFSDGVGESESRPSSATARSLLRRGTIERTRSAKSRPSADVFSDGDASYARNVGVSHLSSHSFADKPSRIPGPRRLPSANSLSRVFDPPPAEPAGEEPTPRPGRAERSLIPNRLVVSPTASRSSSSRPASRAEHRSGRSTPAEGYRDSAESSTSTRPRPPLSRHASSSRMLKGKSRDPSLSQDCDSRSTSSKTSTSRDLGVARPTTSSTNKVAPMRRVPSGAPAGHRVSAIANHFNKMTREAERERQRKLALFRNKRARPVAIAHPTIRVFDNVKEAAIESDEDSSLSSDGADDEYDDDVEQPDPDDEQQKPGASRTECSTREPSVASSKETFVYDNPAQGVSEVHMHHPVSQTTEGPDAVCELKGTDSGALCVKVEGPESGAVSVPQSPRIDGAYPIPRMSEGESSGNERGSIIKAISNLWNYRGGEFTPLEYPLHASEHIFSDNPILVREDEPSSILAFALSSKAYQEKIKEHDLARVVERSEAFMPDELHPADRSTTWGLLDLQDGTDVEETLRKPEAKHFRLQFEEGTTKFFCKIFFAEQFDALRRNCGCSTQFVESLARCVKWESSGGRSKVDFLKTRDDRFIVKEISRLEMDSLLRFAPAYFDYMSKAFFHGLPTILAKIYGFYRIGLRNPTTGKVMRLDVLVMENLFYERTLTQVFDLKGSTRNRHVQVSKDRPNEVLMDENLVEISYKNPLYVREASKRFIKAAIYNDSLFLSNLNVMDYSLVVGVSSDKQELFVGIVDFIRTYTWDKKLESWVKDTAFLGGGSSKPGGPTIVTPKQYKNRFREAMEGYFLLAPDPWVDEKSLQPIYHTASTAPETFAVHLGTPIPTPTPTT